ncbi:MAG: nucleotidyltransferase family protein [Alphaproteobacteria bacterium]
MAHMQRRRRPELISLLEAISSTRRDLSLSNFCPRTVAWAIQSGLGPLLYRAAKDNSDNSSSGYWSDLKAADLTARVVMAEHLEAMAEIIDACRGKVPPLALLKGISIAEEYYPEPHLRLMRDIDILIEKESLPKVKTALEELGYRQYWDDAAPLYDYDTHHHAAPFFHEEKNVWVEVHHALLSPKKRAGSATIFQSDNVFNQLRHSQFQGRGVRRLSAELQLVYLATHWAQDFQRVGGLVAIIDAIHLFKHVDGQLCWEWIVNSPRESIAATYLYLLLSYIDRQQLVKIPTEILRDLFLAQHSFGKASLRTAHAIIDRYYATGKQLGWFSRKVVTLIWLILMLAVPTLHSLMHATAHSILPCRWRVL